jgi:hypothetical protein
MLLYLEEILRCTRCRFASAALPTGRRWVHAAYQVVRRGKNMICGPHRPQSSPHDRLCSRLPIICNRDRPHKQPQLQLIEPIACSLTQPLDLLCKRFVCLVLVLDPAACCCSRGQCRRYPLRARQSQAIACLRHLQRSTDVAVPPVSADCLSQNGVVLPGKCERAIAPQTLDDCKGFGHSAHAPRACQIRFRPGRSHP